MDGDDEYDLTYERWIREMESRQMPFKSDKARREPFWEAILDQSGEGLTPGDVLKQAIARCEAKRDAAKQAALEAFIRNDLKPIYVEQVFEDFVSGMYEGAD